MAHLDAKQPPTKGKPWATIAGQGFIQRVDLLLPQECAEIVSASLQSPRYSRVIMKLEDILQGDFFREYIKIGNIMMLSEGRTGLDNVFMLREGLLTMYLDKETYERAGLVGEPHGVKGRRGSRPRWTVKYQLRDGSMLHGKKGFERLLYACRNVLNKPMEWLFCNLSNKASIGPEPIIAHLPTDFTAKPGQSSALALLPSLKPSTDIISKGDQLAFDELAADVYEWVSLARLESPRIQVGDNIDSHLSRYQVPGADSGAIRANICKLTWRGFIPPNWVRSVLIETLSRLPSKTWFALSATSFPSGVLQDCSDFTLVRPANSPDEYMLWEVSKQE